MEAEVADDQLGSPEEPAAGTAPTWEALWPARRSPGPPPQSKPAEGEAEPSAPPALTGRTTTGGHDARKLEARLELKVAELSKVQESRHAELVERTRSEIQALRTSMEGRLAELLAATESRSAEREARLDRNLAAVSGGLSEQMAALTVSVGEAPARLAELERALREETRALVASVEAVRRDVTGTEAATAELARQVEVGIHAQHALNGRIEGVDAQLQTVVGELAQLRRQLAATEARLDQRLVPLVQRLSETGSLTDALMSSRQADVARVTALGDELRDQLAALERQLEDRVVRELAGAGSELDARLMTLDAVVGAVDAAAAAVETGLAERVTGAATVAATSALAPVRSDLRSVRAEVAATQRSLRELRRQMRTSPPPAAAGASTAGTSTKATPKRASLEDPAAVTPGGLRRATTTTGTRRRPDPQGEAPRGAGRGS
jgi:DNA repair exonuclease SbcCD ATPase subunit